MRAPARATWENDAFMDATLQPTALQRHVLATLRVLLRPIVRLSIAHGVKFQQLSELLKVVLLDVAESDLRVVGFHSHVRVARLPAVEVSAFGDPELLFMNVNTPGDLGVAEAHATTAHGGDHRTQAQRQDDAGGTARR